MTFLSNKNKTTGHERYNRALNVTSDASLTIFGRFPDLRLIFLPSQIIIQWTLENLASLTVAETVMDFNHIPFYFFLQNTKYTLIIILKTKENKIIF